MAGPFAQFYEEHGSLAAVLNAMTALVREVRERGKRIDPKVFRAILYYEAEFAAHRDPLAGASPETEQGQLFRRIVTIVPAPFGVGPPLVA